MTITKEQIANNYKLAARAVNEGIMIRPKNWGSNEYIRFKDISWVDESRMIYDFIDSDFYDAAWQEYKEQPKLVTWYRAKTIWLKGSATPIVENSRYQKSKEEILKRLKEREERSVKVVEWDEIESPETYEDLENYEN